MSGGAGAGGMAIAAQAMREMGRTIERAGRTRIDRIKGARTVARRMKNRTAVARRTEFQCFFVCSSCGYLALSDQRCCTACGHRAWVDMGDEGTAECWRNYEQRQRSMIPKKVNALIVVVLLLVGVGLTWPLGMFGVGLSVILFPTAYLLTQRPLSVYLARHEKTKLPVRWRMPVPFPDRGYQATLDQTGIASGTERCIAPLSKKPCLAYQLSVIFDSPDDGRPAERVLVESGNTEFNVETAVVPPDHIVMIDRLNPVLDGKLSDFAFEAFLRARGLFRVDGNWELYETTVQPGDFVRIQQYANSPSFILGRANV